MTEPLKATEKPFLPSPRYLPLARFLFCIIGMFAIFGLISALEAVEPRPIGLLKIAFALYVTCLAGAFFFFGQYGWKMFVKGGWREEHRRYLAKFDRPKQPWEKD